jgi:hypothetical protein
LPKAVASLEWTIILSIVSIINIVEERIYSYDDALAIFHSTVFSTLSATIDTSITRHHNKPYYLSESYAKAIAPERDDLLVLARFRSPNTSLVSRLSRHPIGISEREDTRHPLDPYQDFVNALDAYGVRTLFEVLPNYHHGYYMRGECIPKILNYWKK